MSFFDDITPATPDKVNLYAPYFMKSNSKRMILPKAIALYYKGGLQGRRIIQGEEPIPYVMNWAIQHLPGDLTRCSLTFDENTDFTYDMNLMNSELISFMIDWLIAVRDRNTPDFPVAFYHKLLRIDD